MTTMKMLSLDQVNINEPVMIKQLNTPEPSYRHKLLAMGVTPGCEVTMIRTAPLGDPIQVMIRGFQLCLRKKEAASIIVEKRAQ